LSQTRLLASKYGGQAEAAAKAGLGVMTQLKTSWGDFLEQIGEIIMPVVQSLARTLQGVVAALQNMDPHWKKFIVTVMVVAAAIGPVLLTLGGILKLLPFPTTSPAAGSGGYRKSSATPHTTRKYKGKPSVDGFFIGKRLIIQQKSC
jgi:hypothetical protein